MGFDLVIELSLQMCPETGKPFYYDRNFEKVYELPELTIPDELKNYLQQRGHYLHAYTEGFNEQEIFDTDLHSFMEEFPCWEEVKEHPNYDDMWAEEDHTKFENLLTYLSSCPASYRVTWSY